MPRTLFISMLAASLLSSASLAQDIKGKEGFKKEVAPKSEPASKTKAATSSPHTADEEHGAGDVDILFLNGSKVRVALLTDKLEIASIYGKLTVPVQDVLAIEFGLRYPDGVVDQIDRALEHLSSGDYRAREKAAKTLLNLGPYAYPAVLRATKAKESEVAARAKDLVQKIQAKYSKKDLKTSTDDRVVTPTQTIVGRILTKSVKTKADYFGEIEHKLANMRTLRAITNSPAEATVAVDAAKYANAGQWMDTAYQVNGNSRVLITAKGLVDQWPQQPGQYMCGPGGNQRGFGGNMQIQPGGKVRFGGNAGQIYGGMLIGKIGETGEPFLIGDHYELKSEAEGKLYLQIGPSPWNCATTGSYDVKITRKAD